MYRILRTAAPEPREALPDPLALGVSVTLMPEPGGLNRPHTDLRLHRSL